MRDCVSLNSSREPTPCDDNVYTSSSRRYSAASNPIGNLSEDFHRHSLTHRRPNISRERSTPRAREHNQGLQLSNSFDNRVCRQRKSLIRLQCFSTHHSRLSALLEDMVQTGLDTYHPTHPKLMLHDSISPSLSPAEQLPSASPFFGFAPLSPSSTSAFGSHGYGSAHHSSRPPQSYKIDEDSRHSALKDAIGGTTMMVKKKIRLRKSSKSLSSGTRKSRE